MLYFIVYVLSFQKAIPSALLSILTITIETKMQSCCARDSNPGPHDYGCRQIHWAMTAP